MIIWLTPPPPSTVHVVYEWPPMQITDRDDGSTTLMIFEKQNAICIAANSTTLFNDDVYSYAFTEY